MPASATVDKDDSKNKSSFYSILLPTYNEKDNLPYIIWLIMKYMTER